MFIFAMATIKDRWILTNSFAGNFASKFVIVSLVSVVLFSR
jgi:hypothetical protein